MKRKKQIHKDVYDDTVGLSIPALLHRTRLDPKVAAGPLVLCLTDLFTLFFYFSIASILL